MLYGTGIWIGGIAQYILVALIGIGYRSGSDSIAVGVNTKSILFSSNAPSTSYSISVIIINTVDLTIQTFPDLKVTSKAIGGFNLDLGGFTITGNNVVDWSIHPHA